MATVFAVRHLLVAAAMLCGDRGYYATQTTAAVIATKSLTSQVGGYAVFECPIPTQYKGYPHVVQWTKEVSVFTCDVNM